MIIMYYTIKIIKPNNLKKLFHLNSNTTLSIRDIEQKHYNIQDTWMFFILISTISYTIIFVKKITNSTLIYKLHINNNHRCKS